MILYKTLRATFLGVGIVIASASLAAHGADPGAKTPPATQGSTTQPTGNALDRFKAKVDKLNLTDDQKPKIEALFATAREEWKTAEKSTDPKEQKAKINAASDKLRKSVGDVLTNEQKVALVKEMQPPGVRTQIDKIKAQLHKPELKLTDDQIQKVDAILDESLKKFEDILADGKKNGTNTHAPMAAASKEMHDKLMEVLSPDQQEQFTPKK